MPLVAILYKFWRNLFVFSHSFPFNIFFITIKNFSFVIISTSPIIFLKNFILFSEFSKKCSNVCSSSVKSPKGNSVIFSVLIIKKKINFGDGLLRCFSVNGGRSRIFSYSDFVSDQ